MEKFLIILKKYKNVLKKVLITLSIIILLFIGFFTWVFYVTGYVSHSPEAQEILRKWREERERIENERIELLNDSIVKDEK